MDPDDVAYKKSVRNMVLVLAAIAITIFAAVFASPFLFPAPDTFQQSVSYESAFGFTLHLQINATSVPAGGGILVRGWLNGSSSSIENVTAADSWGVGPAGLWDNPCTPGWPLGVGVMAGRYTQDNVTFGTFVSFPEPFCPVGPPDPGYFLLSPHSSKALVDLGGAPHYWVLQTSLSLGPSQLPKGSYTAVLADEWGDVVITNFAVS